MDNFELSKDQIEAFDAFTAWKQDNRPLFTLGGCAGSGKSFLISYIKKMNPKMRIAFCAFTGKASNVLRNKLKGCLGINDYVGTIHSLIYIPIVDKNKKIKGWKRRKELRYDLIIIDEASMVDAQIFRDISTYSIPIVAVGDHYQLPPVSESDFNLMSKLDARLDTPHRFLANLPLIQLANIARTEGKLPFKDFGGGVSKIRYFPFMGENSGFAKFVGNGQDFLRGESVVICAYNKTRITLNTRIREMLGKIGDVVSNDRVVCLKNNKDTSPVIYNGMQGTIQKIQTNPVNSETYVADILLDGEDDELCSIIKKDAFNNAAPDFGGKKNKGINFFDFGYSLTCHKCQGGQYENVLVIEQECDLWEHARWLYTAVTRSTKNLTIVR